MTSFKERVATAKLPERTVEICMRGDLQARFEDLERELRTAQESIPADGRIVGNPEANRLATEIELLRMEMVESVEVFRLRALPRGRYTALMADHPPVDGDEDMAKLGYNPETFFADVVFRSIVEPADVDAEGWAAFLETITDYQFNELAAVVTALNHRKVNVPFSRAASLLTRPSGPESTPQGG